MGKLERIWIKRGSGAPMDEVSSAQLVAGRGIVGNANQGGKRQVTLLSSEAWNDATADVMRPFDSRALAQGKPDPSVRRANLLVSSVDFRDSRGKTLRIGNVRIRIYGETRPCYHM